MFINFTNHSSKNWEKSQLQEALKYGNIKDIPFPNVSPSASEEEITLLAEEKINEILTFQPKAVLCQGEFTLVYQIVSKLKEKRIPVLAACSERCVKEEDNKKIVTFAFEQFRKY